jgi:hypothetical protein
MRNTIDLTQAYEIVEDLSTLTHWQLAMWAACEVCFGVFHDPKNCVARIRMELPFEHEYNRCLKYTMDNFEKTLKEKCPKMKGNVHDWYEVFLTVPTKILLYEDFFG